MDRSRLVLSPLAETTCSSRTPNQYPEKAIPKFSTLAKCGGKISIHGDGDATRAYTHVDERTAQIYNVGSREERHSLPHFARL